MPPTVAWPSLSPDVPRFSRSPSSYLLQCASDMFNSYSSYTALPKDEDAGERRANTTGVRASTWLGAAPSRGPAVLALSLVAHALIFLSIVAYVSRHGQNLGSPQTFPQKLYCAFSHSKRPPLNTGGRGGEG